MGRGRQTRSWAEASASGHTITGAQFRAEGLREKSLFNVPHLLVEALTQAGWFNRAEFLWVKPSVVPGKERDAPEAATESVFLLTKRPSGYVYNADVLREKSAGRFGRPHRNVWEIAPSQFRSRHTAVMPEELAARCILTGSPIGGLILDPFAGTGTTGLVARAYGRNAHLIELNKAFVSIMRDRLRNQ